VNTAYVRSRSSTAWVGKWIETRNAISKLFPVLSARSRCNDTPEIEAVFAAPTGDWWWIMTDGRARWKDAECSVDRSCWRGETRRVYHTLLCRWRRWIRRACERRACKNGSICVIIYYASIARFRRRSTSVANCSPLDYLIVRARSLQDDLKLLKPETILCIPCCIRAVYEGNFSPKQRDSPK